MLFRLVRGQRLGIGSVSPRSWKRGLALVGLSTVVTIVFGAGLPPPDAAPNLRPVADLEAEQPLYQLAVLRPPAQEIFDAEIAPTGLIRMVEVGKGDTLMGLLVEAGISRAEAHDAIKALAEVYSPRNLRPGQALRLALQPSSLNKDRSDANAQLLAMSLEPSADETVRVQRDDTAEGFLATTFERPLTRELVGGGGVIESSLFQAGQEVGVPTPVMIELIRAFSYDVDFQREVRKADDFELIYESHYDETGSLAKTGAVIYAALTLSGRRLELYRFTPKSGRADYFDPQGQSVRKALLRTPIDGARISSGFGMRKHPILGYSKMHRGIDFAAPRGTPVFAAGDAVVAQAGRNGSYGKYVRLRHTSSYDTAYAHLHRFAKGIQPGTRVKQGDVIGYVGSTGRSTGPHLHYEVLKQGRQMNPAELKLPSGEKLRGADLEAFVLERERIDRLRNSGDGKGLVASAECIVPLGSAHYLSDAGFRHGESDGGC